MENKVPLIPTAPWPQQISSQAGSVQASVWRDASKALELTPPRLKRARNLLPARPCHTVGAHKVLGARRHPYQHLQPLLPPLWQVCRLFTSPSRSKKLLRSAALPSDRRLLSSNASYPHFLIHDIWVAPGCVSRAHPCWKPRDRPLAQWCSPAPHAGFTRSSGDLAPLEQREKTRESLIITTLTFHLFLFHFLQWMLINTNASLKTRITKDWAMSNPYEWTIEGLQLIIPPQSPIMDFCLLLYQVGRGEVGTHRGKGGQFKESVGVLAACKKLSQKSAPCFFNASHLSCHSYYRVDCTLHLSFVVVAMSEHGTCGCHNWELADWFMWTYKPTKPKDICYSLTFWMFLSPLMEHISGKWKFISSSKFGFPSVEESLSVIHLCYGNHPTTSPLNSSRLIYLHQ